MWVANAVSPILPETPEGARASDAFSIDGQTTGAKSANLFAGFTNPAINIVNGNLAWSSGGHKFAKASDSQTATFVSTYSCMDSEVTARMGVGKIVLRYDAATGSGLALSVASNGTIGMGPTVSGLLLSDFNTIAAFQLSANLADFGWTALNENDTFTFGLVGFSGYVKWNGITVLSWTNLYQPVAGKSIIWAHPAYDGVGDANVTYIPATIFSNRASKLYDLRDFGLKSSQTTGSISSGSNQLPVANSSGFNIGDRIIVATGGEAGAGLRGTMGVGGAWPALSYADATAMNADTGQANNTPAWLRSTGYVYINVNGTWTINRNGDSPDGQSIDFGDYYTQKASPKALVATITGKSGNVLTLDQTASATTTSADVHFDNYSAFVPLWASSPTDLKLRVPSGDYALGQSISPSFKHGFTLQGYGNPKPRLFAPNGAPNLGIYLSQSDYVTVHDFRLEGNHKLGASGHAEYFNVPTDGTGKFVSNWCNTLGMAISTGCIIRDVDVTDVLAFAVVFRDTVGGGARRCTLTMNAPVEAYTQWYMSSGGAVDLEYRDCTVLYAKSLLKTFETFVGTRNKYINCGGMNVLCSTNNSWDWVYDGFYSTIMQDSYYYVNAGFWNEPVMNINDNAYQSGNTGLILNPRIVQTGYINANHDTLPAISVAAVVTDVTIIGEYEGLSAPFPDNLGGFFSAPDYGVIDPNLQTRGVIGPSIGMGITINAPRTTVRGLRVVGAAKSGVKNLAVTSTATAAAVSGCIADTFSFQADTTKSGNRTNAGVSVP